MPGGLHPPLRVIATWPAPNYVNPTLRPKTVVILAGTLGPIMLAMVLARIYLRIVIQRNAWIDDWLMVAAMLPVIGLIVCICLSVERYGFNKHIWDNGSDMWVLQRKITFVMYLLYVYAGGLVKCSILLFYRRLDARSVTRGFRYATWISIASVIVFIVIFTILAFTACLPWGAFWDQFDVVRVMQGYHYNCANEEAILMAASVFNAAQDALTAFLPTLLFWRLQMPRRQKIALGGVFALGYITCVVAGIRIFFMWRLYNVTYDTSWNVWTSWLLTMVEITLGAICGTAPTLKAFVSYIWPRLSYRLGFKKIASSLRKGRSNRSKSSCDKLSGKQISNATTNSGNTIVTEFSKELCEIDDMHLTALATVNKDEELEKGYMSVSEPESPREAESKGVFSRWFRSGKNDLPEIPIGTNTIDEAVASVWKHNSSFWRLKSADGQRSSVNMSTLQRREDV